MDFILKYILKRRLIYFGSNYSIDIVVIFGYVFLFFRGEIILKSICEFENIRRFVKRFKSDFERFFLDIGLKRKSK